MNHAQFWGGAAAPFEIEQSLRTGSDNQNLQRTLSASGNRRTWTWSGWIKRGEISAEQHFLESWNGSGDVLIYARFNSNDKIRVKQFDGSTNLELDTTAVFRDPSAWYHIVISFDTTQATAADRAKIYVNGELQSLSTATYPSQNYETFMNRSGYRFGLMGALWSTFYSRSFNGYMAEAHLIDGSALDPTSFGETNNDGVWVPVEYTGSHGTEGCYIKFDPTATNGIGHDHSGNGNNLTNNNFTTSGTGTDVMSDTPTTNWCTLNPLLNQGGSLSEGNLVFTGVGTSYQGSRGTIAIPSSGKWYWETTATTHTTTVGNWTAVGMATAAVPLNSFAGGVTGCVFYGDRNDANSGIFNDTSTVDQGTTTNFSQGDILQCAYDADTGKFWFGLNNSWWDSSVGTTGDPSAGTNETLTAVSREYFPFVQTNRTHVITTNFGQRAFEYTPPTGYKALNTANLPAPDIADGSDYFNTVLYTGNGSTQSITGVGFQPDFTWIKKRASTGNHMLTDVVRGPNTEINSNTTAAETANTNALTSFDTDGFSVGADGAVNINNEGLVAWNWLAGGSGSSNTDGTITSTVSANPTAGFSIVTYTGTGSAATVGHGLGVAPSFFIVKNRDSVQGWRVYHSALSSASKYLELNTSAAEDTANSVFNGTAPTSSVFSIGDGGAVNNSGDNHIAYCFAEVEGYSKFGSYTGNGTTTGDGPFVWCGFRPAFIVLKSSSASDNWRMYDNKRLGYNPNNSLLYPNLSNQEAATTDHVDILSNGFKLRSDNNNTSGVTYIFMCFAENPFGGSGVSPATAR